MHSMLQEEKGQALLCSPLSPVSTHYLGGYSLVRTWSSPPFVHQFHKNKQTKKTNNKQTTKHINFTMAA